MRVRLLSVAVTGLLGCLTLAGWAQSIRLAFPDTTVQRGDTLVLPILAAQNFTQIVSAQFSIRWNPDVMRYLGQSSGQLNQVAIGPTAAAQGILRFSWFDVTGQGVSLPNGEQLVRLHFHAEGQNGDSTQVYISNDPLRIQIFRNGSAPGLFDSLALAQDTGVVRITTPWQPILEAQSATCAGQANGAITVQTTGAPPGIVFRWSGPDDFSATTPSLTGLRAGIYALRVENAQGVLLYETSIEVTEPPALRIDSIHISPGGCVPGGGSAEIDIAGGTPGYQYALQGGAPQNTNQFLGLQAGVYSLAVTDAAGCTLQAQFVIEAAEPPQPNLGDDLTLCPGENTTLDPGDFAAYHWSDGSTQRRLTVSQSGLYSVTVTDARGCTGSDTTRITVSGQVHVVLENFDLRICPGDSLQLRVSGGSDYRWIDTSRTLNRTDIANPVAKPRTTTLYTVIASTACASDTASFLVQIYDVRGQAGPDTCVQRGQPVQLFATGGVSYIWDRSEFPFSSYTSPTPTVTPLRTSMFRVTIREFNGCQTVREVKVEILDGAPNIRLVNLITPNGDGKNDVLEFEGLGKFSNNALKVYNRWGDLVYQKLGYQTDAERFDGSWRGKPLPAGHYFYVLSVAHTDFKQTLTIVRD